MKIKIVPAVGGGSPLELEVSPNATIGAVRTKVCAIKKLPPDTTRLTYKGRALKDTETLESIGATDGDKFVLITRTVGGSTENLYVELPESAWHKRLALEYSLIQEHEPTFYPVENDLTHYEGVIVGTDLYAGGYFKVEIILPRSYPFYPPDVIWHTRVWHPNFSDSVPARVCDSVFKEHWSPSLRLVAIIESLRNLLNNPNPEDPLNPIAAFEYKNRPDIFVARVRQFVEEYASPDQVFKQVRRKGL